MSRINLGKKIIEALPTPRDGKRAAYTDTRVPGLGVMVQPTGNKVYFWFRKIRGRRTWKTLGEFPAMSVEQARDKAQEINTQFAKWKSNDYQGRSPLGTRQRGLSFKFVLEDYIKKWLTDEAKNPDRAIKGVRWQFDKYIPSWLDRNINSVRSEDVLALQHEVRKKHGLFTSNRLIQLLRALYNWAKNNMGWVGDNPAQIAIFSERKFRRKIYLTREVIPRFWNALSLEPRRDLQHFVIMSLFTGARMGDVLSARWENITLDPPAWTIPNPKNEEPYQVPLMAEVIALLKERRESRLNDNPWVFPGRGRTGHLTGFKHSWPALLKRAKIADLRIHDLRRTLASWQAEKNTSLHIIGATLGHRSTEATKVYAYLQTDPVKLSMEVATRAMLAAKEEEQK